MRLSLRFVLPLVFVLVAIAYLVVPMVDQLTLRWFVRDMDMRSALIANTLQVPLDEQLALGNKARIADFFSRITQDQRLYAIGYCASLEDKPIASELFPTEIECNKLDRWTSSPLLPLPGQRGPLHVTVMPMMNDVTPAAHLVLVHDLSFMARRSAESKRYIFYFFIGLTVVVSLVTVVIAQLSWRGWMAGMRALLRGEGLLRQPTESLEKPELRPVARDLKELIDELGVC